MLAYLDNVARDLKVELVYKVSGDSGKASRLKDKDDFKLQWHDFAKNHVMHPVRWLVLRLETQ